VRILDFTWVLAGPYGTRILADLGAEVIKVQTDRRLVGYVGDGYFTTWNRNKLGITADLDHREARAILGDLLKVCDVVVDNFSARVMRQWGFDDDELLARRPDLIVAHLTGMGRSGPYEHFVSYGPTAQSLAGLTGQTGYPGEPPIGLGYSFSDHVAGLVLANAILAALHHRDRAGEGQVVDVSQFESTASLLGPAYLEAAMGRAAEPAGNAGWPLSAGPAGVFRCAGDDRWIAVEVANEAAREALARLAGEATSGALQQWLADRDAWDAAILLQQNGIAASVVADAVDLIERDEAMRGFWWIAEHPELGPLRSDGCPVHFSEATLPDPFASPLLGQHNDQIFHKLLGLPRERVGQLEAAGVLK
jgi:crotonobetainyl-CoA:carnitine CoA-transferase CaiB-like acyl-CoA transferase